jgi:hypothetical protein
VPPATGQVPTAKRTPSISEIAGNPQSGSCHPFPCRAQCFQRSLVAEDLGQEAIGSDSTSYRHLKTQLQPVGLPAEMMASMAKRSATDIGLDPTTMLPAVLAYEVHPDNGASIPISIEAHYSNYQDVNGVKIPFLIQRYVNNSLQLEISLTSAQVN